jgi:hypothetical protein
MRKFKLSKFSGEQFLESNRERGQEDDRRTGVAGMGESGKGGGGRVQEDEMDFGNFIHRNRTNHNKHNHHRMAKKEIQICEIHLRTKYQAMALKIKKARAEHD